MPDAIFRTNHPYDPKILKHFRGGQIPYNDDSMIRYRILKDGFHWYENTSALISST
jgi:hypothetical protein